MRSMQTKQKDIKTSVLDFKTHIFRCLINARHDIFKRLCLIFTIPFLILLCAIHIMARLTLTTDEYDFLAPKILVITFLVWAIISVVFIFVTSRPFNFQQQEVIDTDSNA